MYQFLCYLIDECKLRMLHALTLLKHMNQTTNPILLHTVLFVGKSGMPEVLHILSTHGWSTVLCNCWHRQTVFRKEIHTWLHWLVLQFSLFVMVVRTDMLGCHNAVWYMVEHLFYGPDALPATKPSVSVHWGKHKALTLTSGFALSYLLPPLDSW